MSKILKPNLEYPDPKKNVSFIFQGIVSPHDLAITQRGDAVYVVEVPTDRSSTKIHKYDVISNNNNAEDSENNPEPDMGLGSFAF